MLMVALSLTWVTISDFLLRLKVSSVDDWLPRCNVRSEGMQVWRGGLTTDLSGSIMNMLNWCD